MGRRIGAYLIDVAIGWAVMAAVFMAVSESVTVAGLSCDVEGAPELCFQTGDTLRFAEGSDASLVTISGLVVWALMGIVIQGATGATPGKAVFGLRVVRQEDGTLAGFGRCAARTVLWIVDAFPYVIPLVGLIAAAASKGNRRVGDMAARTLVIRASAVGTPPIVAGLTVQAARWPQAPGPAATTPGGWMPPTGPPSQPSASTVADPFASPAGQVFPGPDRNDAAPPEPVAGFDAPPPAVAPTPPPVDQPRWDPQRNAYVWFDPAQQRWLVHDTATNDWRPA